MEGELSAGVQNIEIQVPNHPPTGNPFFFREQLLSYSCLTTVGIFGITGTIYKISYNTVDPQGRLVEASGVVGVPPISPAFGLVSVQHGTIIDHADAPSELGDSLFKGTEVLPIGFILIMANYLGFGESTQFLHPYHHAETLGTSTVDAIRAGKTLFKILRTSYRDRLFLTGYSEGGFSTLVLQREIELNHPGEFNLVASVAGSGA